MKDLYPDTHGLTCCFNALQLMSDVEVCDTNIIRCGMSTNCPLIANDKDVCFDR